MENTSANLSEQDYTAALHEIKSNLDIRRLMFVLSNVLIPAVGVAMIDALGGNHYPPALVWLAENILAISGAILTLAGILVSAILTRCHYGMVVNGNKLDRVESGELHLQSLNWLGVTTNFVALTALYAGVGLGLLLAALGLGLWSLLAGFVLIVLLMGFLRWNHYRANRLSAQLVESWQPGTVALRYREEHARMSLDATTADISVIVVMAIALFSGAYNCMTSIGGLSGGLTITPSVDLIQTWGVPVIGVFTLLSLLLSGRMVVRLRIALAQHAQKLAELRDEHDRPWRFRPQERTFLLFMLLHLLCSAALLILVWSLTDQTPAIVAGTALLLLGLVWYPWQLSRHRKRAQV